MAQTKAIPSFEEFMQNFCKLANLKDVHRHTMGAPFYIEDVKFSFLHDAKRIDPNRFFLVTVFGFPPGDKKPGEVFGALLLHNHAMFKGRGPGFTISPTTGEIMYAMHFRLDRIRPQEVFNAIGNLADMAHEWRTTHFLDKGSSSTLSSQLRRLPRSASLERTD